MSRLTVLLAVAALGTMFAEADAQQPRQPRRQYQRFQSSRPTLSPYLNYFRRDNGLVTPYQNFIQPYQRQQAYKERIEYNERTLRDRIRQQNEQIKENSDSQMLQQRASRLPITGIGSTYQNYSHFYSLGGTGARR